MENKMMTKQTILITGGNGFIGYAMSCALQVDKAKYKVLAPKSAELNLLDAKSVADYFSKNQIDLVCHLAARHAGVGSGINQPLLFLEDNLLINYNIVAAARKNNVKKFVTLGSSCTYQVNLTYPAREADLWDQRAENTYGTCKQILLEHLQAQDTMQWVYLIPPNLYGPGDHFGEGGTHFIPATVQKFQYARDNGQKSITVWGDGSQSRDFLYLRDIIKLLREAIASDKYDGKPVNIATGRQTTIKKATELIQKNLCFEDIAVNWAPNKPVGLSKRELDNSLFLSINPSYNFVQVEDGIKETIDWYMRGAKREDVLCYIK